MSGMWEAGRNVVERAVSLAQKTGFGRQAERAPKLGPALGYSSHTQAYTHTQIDTHGITSLGRLFCSHIDRCRGKAAARPPGREG